MAFLKPVYTTIDGNFQNSSRHLNNITCNITTMMGSNFKHLPRQFAKFPFLKAISLCIFVYIVWNSCSIAKYNSYRNVVPRSTEEIKNGESKKNYLESARLKLFYDTTNSQKPKRDNTAVETQASFEIFSDENRSDKNFTMDQLYGPGCGSNPNKENLQKLLKFWSKMAEIERLDYVLCSGTLLGYKRHRDFLPFDHDVDICMNIKNFSGLLTLESMRPIDITDKKPHLIIPKKVASQRRLNCQGDLVDRQVDQCSIISPAGRILLGKTNFLDIYLYTVGESYMEREGEFRFTTRNIYPTKRCWMGGIVTRCPNRPDPILQSAFGKDAVSRPSLVCRNGQFVAVDGKKIPWTIKQVNNLLLKKWKRKKESY